MDMSSAVRLPAVSGAFYPAEATELRATVEALIRHASGQRVASSPVPPKAIVVPHAGYVYSGPTAAVGYATLLPYRDVYRRVALIGPAHRVPVRGLAVPTAAAFRTPLGDVPLDRAAIEALVQHHPQVRYYDEAHAFEHSLEVQLPFLQYVLGDFALVPIVAGWTNPQAVATALGDFADDPVTLLVISSDLSHYLPDRVARQKDHTTIERIVAGDPTIGPDEACGCLGIDGLTMLAQTLGWQPQVLAYATSADTIGPADRVVGYTSMAYYPALESAHESLHPRTH